MEIRPEYTEAEIEGHWSQLMAGPGKWLLADTCWNSVNTAFWRVIMVGIVFKLFSTDQLALRELAMSVCGGLITWIIAIKTIERISLRKMVLINAAGYLIYLAWLVDPMYWLISGAIWNGLTNSWYSLFYRRLHVENVHDCLRVRWQNWQSAASEGGMTIGAFLAGLIIADTLSPIVGIIGVGILADIPLTITFVLVWRKKLRT